MSAWIKIFVLGLVLSAGYLPAQGQAPNSDPQTAAQQTQEQTPQPAQAQTSLPYERPASWLKVIPNLASDQKHIWLFPVRLAKGKYLVPTLTVVGTTAALIALDPQDAPYFRRTDSFNRFNRVFSANNTSLGTVIPPAAMYVTGLFLKDRKMKSTALLAGEALLDSEIVTTVMKDIDRRWRPATISPDGNFTDTWFKDTRYLRSNGSFPSGHTIAAFSVATVIARRYGNHRWVPYVAYGGAVLIGFSRVSLSSHFVSDVFMGGALGYSIARFSVLRH